MDAEITNKEIQLRNRPGDIGEPRVNDFSVVDCPYPSESLSNGQVLVKTLYLSVDPIIRFQMNETISIDGICAWQLGKCLEGVLGLGVIVQSESDGFKEGDLVMKSIRWPWTLYFVTDANTLQKVDSETVAGRLSLHISYWSGMSALIGIREKAHVVNGHNQTVVISAAAGGCGSIAGQIFKLDGCGKLIGICGSDDKCNVLTDELGFDVAINYKTDDVKSRLAEECPSGIDVYYDNVGGDVSDVVLSQMNNGSHVVLCGQISQYNLQPKFPPPLKPQITSLIREKNITRDMFYVLAHQDKFDESLEQLRKWLSTGKLKIKETIEEGLENLPKAFVGLMNGKNVGKMLVRVADP